MLISDPHRDEKHRTKELLRRSKLNPAAAISGSDTVNTELSNGLALSLEQAGLRCSAACFVGICLFFGLALAASLSLALALWALPLLFGLGAALPLCWVESRINGRTEKFCVDYPTVLLAAASSLKVGMTAHLALERSVRFLEPQSLVRIEVERLLSNLRRGISREKALEDFGQTIRLPDLELFRSACVLVLENGGRFGPTLERLACVTKDRMTLMSSARVSTAIMRMTANVLLGVIPFVVSLIALRTPNYWDLFRSHPIANPVATIGILIIAGNYLLLHRMSDFKP